MNFANGFLVPFTSHRKHDIIAGICSGVANATIDTGRGRFVFRDQVCEFFEKRFTE